MANSKDEKVQVFLVKVMSENSEKYQVLEALRNIDFELYPDINEKMMYGGIIFSLDRDIGGVFVYKNHVSFEFSNGFKFLDPEKLLEGGGKYRRHLKFKSLDSILIKNAKFYIKQMGEF